MAGLALLGAILPARSFAANEGEPTFGISGYFKSPPRLDQAVTLMVRIWGGDAYDRPVTSVGQISIPEGIDIVSGDTVSIARVDRYSRRRADRVIQIVIRPARYGSYMIHGSLSLDGGDDYGTDETDFYLPLIIQPDTLIYGRAPHTTRYENVRNGQRYRYGGRYLVPIDSSQALLEEEITQKPKPVTVQAAACHGCPGPLPAFVPFVVMVGSDGRIKETRFLDIQEEGSIDPALVTAASNELHEWKFEPAKAGNRAVADYVVVRVPVKDGQP